ncbi:hypothetical protein DFP93_102401 [Aneurinibacillus soli]|uniref:Uncharacterized protein n=1 Tax=Aneurinibacillus soli TaxID=1500254 RepID=A0A0U4WF39_9BACL|nr:hypothetical protein [Aneurinibacillus soli]PYE63712.1 hypothetical protein DFP93_102401 [Aneurinibacillus soli]BAU27355.1 hypothetical protein CB4_01529 [Aneurinibacillus soli]
MAKRKKTGTTRTTGQTDKTQTNSTHSSPFDHLFSSKQLEIITAALLLSGELVTDAIEFGRDGGIVVSLVGKLQNPCQKNPQENRVGELAHFLRNNGTITLDEILAALKQRMQEP